VRDTYRGLLVGGKGEPRRRAGYRVLVVILT
jgi:hypothetical protein